MTSIAPLVVAAALAQAAAAPPPDPGVPPEDPAVLPEGTAEDQQLWRQLRELSNSTTIGMGRIAQCSFRIRYGRYYEGLDEAIGAGSGAERAEAQPLRDRLEAEAEAAQAALPEKPRLRECQYVLRDLGLYMPNLSEPAARQAIPEVRSRARGCVERLKPLSERLLARADALEGALAAIDAFRARREAPAPAGEEGASPVPAASAAPRETEAKP